MPTLPGSENGTKGDFTFELVHYSISGLIKSLIWLIQYLSGKHSLEMVFSPPVLFSR